MSRLPLLICALFAVALMTVVVAPNIDLAVSGWFFADGHFVLENNPLLEFMHQTAVRGAWALGFLFIAMLVASLTLRIRRHPDESRDPAERVSATNDSYARYHKRWIPTFVGTTPKAWLFLLLALLIGPVLITNGILKDHWGRARPHEVTEFGGKANFSPALVPQPNATRNESFIAGDGAFGFFLPVFAYLLPLPQRRRESRMVFWSGVIAGCGFAFSRIAMGSHFFSDNLFAALLMSLSNAALHTALFGRQLTRRYWRLWLNLDNA